MKSKDALKFNQSIVVSVRYDCQHKNNSLTHCCTGIILSESYVLTVADCVDYLHDNNITIVAAFQNRSLSDEIIGIVDRVIVHPNWTNSRNNTKDNIALLHLLSPLDYWIDNNSIARICGTFDLNYSLKKSKRIVIISWNFIKQNFNAMTEFDLLQNEFVFVDNNNDDMKQQFSVQFTHSDSCNYESSEFILQWFDDDRMEVGVRNSVKEEKTDDDCLKVFTRLGYYHQWIESIVISKHETTSIVAETYQCNMYKVSCGCSVENVVLSSERIIGGEEAVPHSWGMVVTIHLNDAMEHACGGSIISPSYILTSAHCVENSLSIPSAVSVAAGIHNRLEYFVNLRYVRRIYIHPEWHRNDSTYQNDIALLYVFPPLPVDNNVNLVSTCVPHGTALYNITNYPSNGSHLVMTGWGSNQTDDDRPSDTLRQASVYVLDNEDPICSQVITNAENQFCAGIQRTDSCYGDEGSPVFQWKGTNWEQVGITSYGGQCNSTDSPSVFTRLAYYFDWIQSVTNISLTTTTTKPPPVYSCNKTSSCGCGKSDVALTSSRIVGGEDSIENSWPMIVSLRLDETNRHSCGGTIISKSYVMTAAHCLRKVSTEHPVGITIAAGMTNRSDPLQIIRTVDQIYMHPNYTSIPGDFRHDIALLHIDQPFIFDSNISITKTCVHRIDPPFLTSEHPKNGTPLSVIGWGTLWSGGIYLPDILQQAQVFAIGNEEPICLNIINNTEWQFCAGLFGGGKDSCQGDSGGPIFQWTGEYWEQVGIVSYGNGCAEPNLPGVYTRLSYYYPWIEKILERDGEHLEPQVVSSTTSQTSDVLSTLEISSYNPISSSTSSIVLTSIDNSNSRKCPNIIYECKRNILIVGLAALLLYVGKM